MANSGIVYHGGIATSTPGDNVNILAVTSDGVPKYVKHTDIAYYGDGGANDTLSNYIRTNVVGELDVAGAQNIGANQTIKSWSEVNGKVSITTQKIQLSMNDVTDLGTLASSVIKGVKISNASQATTYTPDNNGVVTLPILPLPDATTGTKGLVQVGSGLSVSNGLLSVSNWNVSDNTHLNAVIPGQTSENVQVHAGSFYASSDKSLKTNVTKVTDESIDKINKVDIVEFNWKSTGAHSVGVIAQDVRDAGLDSAVSGSETLSVNYVQLLLLKIASLEKRVTELEGRLSKQ